MKFSRLIAATLFTASLLMLPANAALAAPAAGGPGGVAQKSPQPVDPSITRLASIVDKATSPELITGDRPAVRAAGGSFVTRGDIAVTIPADSAKAVTATKQTPAGPITVSVGIGAQAASPGVLASDGSVVYSDAGDTKQTVRPTDDGFRIHTILEDASASTEINHTVALPAGVRLVAGKDMPASKDIPQGGTEVAAVFLVGADDKVIGGFSAPWAKDAQGAAVPTHFEIRSGNLVQIVDHQSAGVVYPVVADPYLGFDLIQSARWVWHSEGWTMEVTPTGWARANAGGYLPGVYGWDELYSKYRYRGLNTNLDGMRDQYICHQQIVALRAPNKPTWNLDEWRPNVSYLETVNASCNPGGPRFFD